MFKEGEMTEYGWYDADTERAIAILQAFYKISREEAIIKYFNEI